MALATRSGGREFSAVIATGVALQWLCTGGVADSGINVRVCGVCLVGGGGGDSSVGVTSVVGESGSSNLSLGEQQ